MIATILDAALQSQSGGRWDLGGGFLENRASGRQNAFWVYANHYGGVPTSYLIRTT